MFTSASSPLVMFVDFAFAGMMLLCGFVAGWWIARRAIGDSAADTHARAAIDKLRELATSVAADVGEHSSRVQEISSELAAVQQSGDDVEDVVLSSVAEIVKANERLQEQLATAEVRLQRQAEEIENQAAVARTDALTGLHNRRAFDDELARRVAEWQRRRTVVSLMMVDVDYFKKFNDQHGHQAGDEVLRGVAQVLKATMREMDLVTRYGGEEFAVILPVTNVAEAVRAAERARAAIAESVFFFETAELQVTASLGVAQIMSNEPGGALVKRADAALYASKSAGRNCVHFHDGDICRAAADCPAPLPAGSGAAPVTRPGAETLGAPDTQAAATTKPAEPESAPKASPDFTAFCARLNGHLAMPREGRVSLLLVDVDGFQALTDKLGASIGELVLDTMSEFLSLAIAKDDVLARYGCGQFAVMMPKAELDAAVRTAERVRSAVSVSAMQVRGNPLRLTISVGAAQSKVGEDGSSLLKRTDAALSAAKAAGQNCTHVHNGQGCEAARTLVGAC